MDKSEFRDIQKKILTLINHTKREDFKRGIDITSPEYADALKKLKTELLRRVGLTLEQYNQIKSDLNKKKPISWIELADRPSIPTLEEITNIVRTLIPSVPAPQIINKTEVVREIIKEQPQVIKTKEIIREVDKGLLSTIEQDLTHLQESNADLYPQIDQLRKELGELVPTGFKEQWEMLTRGGYADAMHSHRVRRSGVDKDTVQKMIDPFIVGEGIHKITVASVAPANPQVGDLWLQWP